MLRSAGVIPQVVDTVNTSAGISLAASFDGVPITDGLLVPASQVSSEQSTLALRTHTLNWPLAQRLEGGLLQAQSGMPNITITGGNGHYLTLVMKAG